MLAGGIPILNGNDQVIKINPPSALCSLSKFNWVVMKNIPTMLQDLPSPSLLFFVEEIEHNLDTCLKWVQNKPDRLRLHAKTHKCPDIIKMQLAKGIKKHKAATIAECEMLARCGAEDVFLAYPLVGPNIGRLCRLVQTYPTTKFSISVDSEEGLDSLALGTESFGSPMEVYLDLDLGMHRTGFPLDGKVDDLYKKICDTPGLKAVGFQAYDGHNHHPDIEERKKEFQRYWPQVMKWKSILEKDGFPTVKIVGGGTPSFLLFSQLDMDEVECSPGTLTLFDLNYMSKFKELAPFRFGAGLITRVISKPGKHLITTDLGYKAVSGDQPAHLRYYFKHHPGLKFQGHSEEHLMLEHDPDSTFKLGEPLLAIPGHVCPTVALHPHAYAISNGEIKAKWEIQARDRDIGC